jgi:hypothetical protein
MRSIVTIVFVVAMATPMDRAAGQRGQDSRDDAAAARTDALLATPNRKTPVPQDNLFATTPRLEQQAPKPGDGGTASPNDPGAKDAGSGPPR